MNRELCEQIIDDLECINSFHYEYCEECEDKDNCPYDSNEG